MGTLRKLARLARRAWTQAKKRAKSMARMLRKALRKHQALMSANPQYRTAVLGGLAAVAKRLGFLAPFAQAAVTAYGAL